MAKDVRGRHRDQYRDDEHSSDRAINGSQNQSGDPGNQLSGIGGDERDETQDARAREQREGRWSSNGGGRNEGGGGSNPGNSGHA